jgi:hypothetical protein
VALFLDLVPLSASLFSVTPVFMTSAPGVLSIFPSFWYDHGVMRTSYRSRQRTPSPRPFKFLALRPSALASGQVSQVVRSGGKKVGKKWEMGATEARKAREPGANSPPDKREKATIVLIFNEYSISYKIR